MISWFSKTENIALVVSIISLLMSVSIAVFQCFSKRENYNISVVDYAKPLPDVIQFLVCLENFSSNPLVIVSVSVHGVSCKIDTRTLRGATSQRQPAQTSPFPLCIQAHGALYCYLEFVSSDLQDIDLAPGKTLTLQIRSTRHTAQKNAPLGNTADYLHRTP